MMVARTQVSAVKIGDNRTGIVAMKYLGVISSDGSMEKKVEARIGSGTRMIGEMNEVLC